MIKREKVILSYSGGLDTSIAIKWLEEKYNFDVIALIGDLGGEEKDLEKEREKALKIGASKCYILDLKEEFANEYLKKALMGNAMYEKIYPLSSALSRPLLAKHLVRIAKTERATSIAHGCTGKGNDQVRFDIGIKSLAPHLKIIAPVRESVMSREEAIAYAKEHNIEIPVAIDNPFSIDVNLWGRSCECGVLEDPWNEPPKEAFAWSNSIYEAPERGEYIEIAFTKGCPTELNGERMKFVTLIKKLNKKTVQHGIGRIDHVENRIVGIKSREIYEAPAALTLIKAHQALESLCLTHDVIHFKYQIEECFANLIYQGMTFSPLFEALWAFILKTQEQVTGRVSLKLHKGNAYVVGRKSTKSLYQYNLATYNPKDSFDHQAATGFIKILSLPLEINAFVNQEKD